LFSTSSASTESEGIWHGGRCWCIDFVEYRLAPDDSDGGTLVPAYEDVDDEVSDADKGFRAIILEEKPPAVPTVVRIAAILGVAFYCLLFYCLYRYVVFCYNWTLDIMCAVYIYWDGGRLYILSIRAILPIYVHEFISLLLLCLSFEVFSAWIRFNWLSRVREAIVRHLCWVSRLKTAIPPWSYEKKNCTFGWKGGRTGAGQGFLSDRICIYELTSADKSTTFSNMWPPCESGKYSSGEERIGFAPPRKYGPMTKSCIPSKPHSRT
jgi:hypothetical protein